MKQGPEGRTAAYIQVEVQIHETLTRASENVKFCTPIVTERLSTGPDVLHFAYNPSLRGACKHELSSSATLLYAMTAEQARPSMQPPKHLALMMSSHQEQRSLLQNHDLAGQHCKKTANKTRTGERMQPI
jgi:hypothetical protein